jgi:hypothetical protein
MALSTNGHNGVHHEADEMIDTLYAWMPGATPAPQPLREAAFSLTLKGKLHGIEALLTARGQSPEEFRRNIESIKGLLDAPQAPVQAASQEGAPIQDWCAKHQVRMQRHENAGGVWYSHYAEGRHCKGR